MSDNSAAATGTVMATEAARTRSSHRWQAWKHALLVPASIRNTALLLFVPLGAQLIIFKLIKFAILSGHAETAKAVPQANLVGHLLMQHAAVPVLLIVLPLFVILAVSTRTGLSAAGSTGLFIGLWGLMTAAASRVLPFEQLWTDERFYSVIRQDLVWLLAGSIAFVAIASRASRWLRVPGTVIAHIVILGAMLIASLDFGYFVMTGSLADSFMLRYALANTSNLSYVVMHEMSGTHLVVMSLPIITVGAAFCYSLRKSSELGERRSSALIVIAAALTTLVAVPAPDLDRSIARIAPATFKELAGEVSHGRNIGFTDRNIADVFEPLFDTKNISLSRTSSQTTPPNIVIIVLESQRHPQFIENESFFSPTPFLDALSRKSLVVENMYATVPHTNKALVPILCGIPPRIAQGDQPDIPGRCLPDLLREHGYRSAFFTPATLIFERKDELLRNMGFDRAFGDGDFDATGFERVNYFGLEERSMIDGSFEWIDEQVSGGNPFMAAFLTISPHHPYKTASHFPERSFVKNRPDYNAYLNALSYVDDFVARLMDGFGQRGLREATVFVIVGDHGEAFGEHGLRFHSAVPYDEVLKVPALVYAPGRVNPDTARGPREQIDIPPTITELAGFAVTAGSLPGTTLTSDVSRGRPLYHAGWIENQSMALREGNTKYVYHFGRRVMERYDMRLDPFERRPYELEETDAEYERVAADLHIWRARVNASYERPR